MRVILKASPFFIQTVGKQTSVESKVYRKNKYIYELQYGSDFLIYNLLTKELISLSHNEYNQYCVCLNTIEVNKQLIEKWFLVPLEYNERELNDQIISLSKMFVDKRYINSFDILPTTDCNARCSYCYELGVKRINMTDDIATKTVTYISQVANNNKIKIRWFGGEPLFNEKVIDIISLGLKEKGITFNARMATNGYLFNENNIRKALDIWNLSSVQIPLDGTEKIYNETKKYIYHSSKSPFTRVINNIDLLLLSDIHVAIRLNVTKSNVYDLCNLVEYLYKRFGNNDNLSIYPHLIVDKKDEQFLQTQVDYNDNTEQWNAFFKLQDMILERGLLKTSPLSNNISPNICMADSENSILISSSGSLGKCDNHIADNYVGNIHAGITDKEKLNYYKICRKPYDKCFECYMYPNCRTLKCCTGGEFIDCLEGEKEYRRRKLEQKIIKTFEANAE